MAESPTEPQSKRFYWLKLKRDFFKRHDIKIIEAMANGKDYVLFYLKLLVESVDHVGALRFSDTVPYNEEMLAVITNTNVDVVRSALKLFTELHMIDVLADNTIYMAEVETMLGGEGWSAERTRKYRKRLAASHVTIGDAHVTSCDVEKEIDIEIDKDKDNPPLPPKGANALFEEFWKAYPKRVGKGAAQKAFVRCKPTRELLNRMLGALDTQRHTDQWTKENGQFIPNPATWLNQGRWEDEVKTAVQADVWGGVPEV